VSIVRRCQATRRRFPPPLQSSFLFSCGSSPLLVKRISPFDEGGFRQRILVNALVVPSLDPSRSVTRSRCFWPFRRPPPNVGDLPLILTYSPSFPSILKVLSSPRDQPTHRRRFMILVLSIFRRVVPAFIRARSPSSLPSVQCWLTHTKGSQCNRHFPPAPAPVDASRPLRVTLPVDGRNLPPGTTPPL